MNWRFALFILCGVFSLVAFKALSSEAESKLSADLLGDFLKPKPRKYSALVIFKEQADLSGAELIANREDRLRFVYDRLTQVAHKYRNALDSLQENDRNVEMQQFYIMNMYAVHNVSKEQIASLAERGNIAKIVTNNEYRALPPIIFDHEIPSLLQNMAADNIRSIGADRVWKELGTQGEGIVVAGQDTGVQWNHPALIKQYRGRDEKGKVDHRYSWHDAIKRPMSSKRNPCGYNLKVPCDDNGHGTHTVGTMVGNDNAKNQIGVAPKAKWIACRNMDGGLGRPSTYIDCFEYFLAPYPQGSDPIRDGAPELAPHVINNSWSCLPSEGCRQSEILPILEVLKAAGIFVVASAGNTGPNCATISAPPAMHTDVAFSVGAHDHRSGGIANFSSRGPSKHDGGMGPDVTAPGVNIRSAIPGSQYSAANWSGTSMAGPHVAGQVALMWSAAEKIVGNYATTAEIIQVTATPIKSTQNCGGVSGQKIPNNVFGYGRINAYEAVKLAKTK